MTTSQAVPHDLDLRLRAVGLRVESAKLLAATVSKWVRNEGPESAVKRLKDLKTAFVQKCAGQSAQLSWIRHSNGIPKGPFRVLWELSESGSFRKTVVAYNAMMCYASIMLPRKAPPTRAQEKKFLDSVRAAPLSQPVVADETRRVCSCTKHFPKYREVKVKEDGISFGLVRGPQRGDDSAQKWFDKHTANLLNTETGRILQSFPEVQAVMPPALREEIWEFYHPWHGMNRNWRDADPDQCDVPIGVIGTTQEPGMKCRLFAAPNIWVQAALEPLKKGLLRMLKESEWDCSHDQSKGVYWAQAQLRAGATVYAVDLSDATNNFPWELQARFLLSLGVTPSAVALLHFVSRAPYRKVWGEKDTIAWTKGQPLGAGPSFMAFALTHAALVMRCEKDEGLQPGTAFRVLGDDIIIAHEGVHTRYRQALSRLAVPVSEAKCLTSSRVTEFAGKLIFREGVAHGYKYRRMSDVSFLDVIRTLGLSALNRFFLTKDQFETALLLRDVPEPEGLGFNPEGLPLSIRTRWLLELQELLRDGADLRFHTERRTRWIRFFYQTGNLVLNQTAHRAWGNYTPDGVDLTYESIGDQPISGDTALRISQVTGAPVVLPVGRNDTLSGLPLVGEMPNVGDPRPNRVLPPRIRALAKARMLDSEEVVRLLEGSSGFNTMNARERMTLLTTRFMTMRRRPRKGNRRMVVKGC